MAPLLPTEAVTMNGRRQTSVIFETFAGSGSTLIMAQRMGRHAIGYEIDQQHVNTSKARLAEDMEK